MKYYYKVTNRDKRSIVAHGRVALTYREGRWTWPKLKGSKIFIFESLRKARQFRKRFAKRARIFRCIAKGSKKFSMSLPAIWFSSRGWVEAKIFWTGRGGRTNLTYHCETPPGTRVAEAVKIVKEIL